MLGMLSFVYYVLANRLQALHVWAWKGGGR